MERKVYVYKNLHRKVWSVRGKSGRVIGHSLQLTLRDCKMVVGEKSRQRVIRDKRKNVHAGIRGIMHDHRPSDYRTWRKITYNPYKAGYFYDIESDEPVHESECVVFDEQEIFAK